MNRPIVKWMVGIVFVLAMTGILIFANHDKPHYTITETSGTEYETARVLRVVEDRTSVNERLENQRVGSKDLEVEILTGRYKGDVVQVTDYFSATYTVDVKTGDKVSVRIDTSGPHVYSVSIYNYHRVPLFVGLIVAFFLALAIMGGKQGIKAFVGLAFTVLCLVFILLPLALKGFATIPLTVAIIVVTSAVCFFLIGGIQTKTIAAAAGSCCGVVLAAVIGQIAAAVGGVTTFQMEQAEALILVKSTTALQMRGLFASGILIAATGAVMDIAMSISSALDELHSQNPKMGWKDLFRSGMTIGRDAMGTMANTLVLAYVGSSLNMMVLIYSYGVGFRQLVNTDFVAIEMIRAVAGSIGIIGTVPCVSLISALLLDKMRVSSYTK